MDGWMDGCHLNCLLIYSAHNGATSVHFGTFSGLAAHQSRTSSLGVPSPSGKSTEVVAVAAALPWPGRIQITFIITTSYHPSSEG